MLRFVLDRTAVPYFSNLVWFISDQSISLNEHIRKHGGCVSRHGCGYARGRPSPLLTAGPSVVPRRWTLQVHVASGPFQAQGHGRGAPG